MFPAHGKPTLLAMSLLVLLLAASGCSGSENTAPSAPSALEDRGEAMEVHIDISPATLVLDSPGTWVTVHAQISLSAVDTQSVTLEGIVPDVIKADNRGELVAKFGRETIASIVSPPEATLTLQGLTAAGEPFAGTDTITVQ